MFVVSVAGEYNYNTFLQALTIGGKPVTVQVTTAGGQKTVTLLTSQASSSSSTATTVSTTPASTTQPTTSLAGASDGPVTSDAALAALAAEAGLIVPSEGEQGNEQNNQQNSFNSAIQNSSDGGGGGEANKPTEGNSVQPEEGETKREEGSNETENTIKQEPMDTEGMTEGNANQTATGNSTTASTEAGDTTDPLATLASAAINSSLSTTTPTIKSEDSTTTLANGLSQESVSTYCSFLFHFYHVIFFYLYTVCNFKEIWISKSRKREEKQNGWT